MSDAKKTVQLLMKGEEESWNSFSRRIKDAQGESIVILSSADNNFLLREEEQKVFLAELAKLRYRVKLATKDPAIMAAARKQGIEVFHRTRMLRNVLGGHPKAQEALRFFSPSLWRQHWRSRLQSIGLLSLPRLRIWAFIILSSALFLFVIFELLPSAEIKVWPRKDVVTHTMNIVLVLSGSTTQFPDHVRTMPLVPITVRTRKVINFQDISPEFIGSDAEVEMTMINKRPEPMQLKGGTRLVNQAGMIFRLKTGVQIPGSGSIVAQAKADHVDLYDKIIGERGNVPAGVEWRLPGLPEDEQKLTYAINRVAARGGRTAYRSVLQQKDLDIARKRLEQELLASAEKLIKEDRELRNFRDATVNYEFLDKGDLIRKTYSGFVLPTHLIGQTVSSVEVAGSIIYTIPAYDTAAILRTFGPELEAHITNGKQLVKGSVELDPEKVIVIEYADNLTWIKITVDIVGTEQYVLEPLTPTGARFGKKVRDAIVDLPSADALRIIRNLPEVQKVDIDLWPPWSRQIPSIPSNIAISPQ